MITLKGITDEAIEEFKEELESSEKSYDEYIDRIHEITDSSVPIYYYEIIKIIQNDIDIALDIPEL